jgi:hypothetical protein
MEFGWTAAVKGFLRPLPWGMTASAMFDQFQDV